jgi:hypothetical protein
MSLEEDLLLQNFLLPQETDITLADWDIIFHQAVCAYKPLSSTSTRSHVHFVLKSLDIYSQI